MLWGDNVLTDVFLSGGFGLLLGVLYDAFRIVRMLTRPTKPTVFLLDVLYFVLSAVATFYFLLGINSFQLRWYLFAAMTVGFFAWRTTGGRAVSLFTVRIARAVTTVWRVLRALITKPFRWLGRKMAQPLYHVGKFLKKPFQKLRLFLKKVLPERLYLLYNWKVNGKPSAVGGDSSDESCQ